MSKIRVMLIFGTRPEAIKMAPIIKAIEARSDNFESIVVVTAQHREILDQPMQLFGIQSAYDLNIMTRDQSLFGVSSRALQGLESILCQEKPDIILVQGDTTTTFIGSLAAFYMKIPVGHVEAGLRTYNKYNPFPEEINRILTGSIANFHFVPTESAQQALLRENIAPERIFLTGNTVIDSLQMILKQECIFEDEKLKNFDFEKHKIILLTTHRRESFGEPIEEVMKSIEIIAKIHPDVRIIFPIHYNPNVRRAAEKILRSYDRILIINPLDYKQFAHLMARSYIILTDSGGIQEEATSLGKPTLILRETTERQEGVDAGSAKLVGTNLRKIVQETIALIEDPQHYQKMARTNNLYGDGTASHQILDILETHREELGAFSQKEHKPQLVSSIPQFPRIEFDGDVKNALTINIEDWDVFSHEEIVMDILKTLDFLTDRKTKATFFVYGWIAEKYPEVIQAIHDLGHEISTHGYSNTLIYNQNAEEFRTGLKKSTDLISQIINEPVLGYRAPGYSIVRKSIWAWDVLLEQGIRYDSSLFPVKHDLYGLPNAPRFPFVISVNENGGLIEFPLSTARIFGENIPIAGGGYLRFYPYWFVKKGIQNINNLHKPANIYLRTWELNPRSFEKGNRILGNFRRRGNFEVMQYRIGNLLNDFEFVPLRNILGYKEQ